MVGGDIRWEAKIQCQQLEQLLVLVTSACSHSRWLLRAMNLFKDLLCWITCTTVYDSLSSSLGLYSNVSVSCFSYFCHCRLLCVFVVAHCKIKITWTCIQAPLEFVTVLSIISRGLIDGLKRMRWGKLLHTLKEEGSCIYVSNKCFCFGSVSSP